MSAVYFGPRLEGPLVIQPTVVMEGRGCKGGCGLPGVHVHMSERVVPAVIPDTAEPCPETSCWEGSMCVQTAPDDYDIVGVCSTCGGTGTVDVLYRAETQWRHIYADGPAAWHSIDETCLDETHALGDERRLAVVERYTVQPLEAVHWRTEPENPSITFGDEGGDGRFWLNTDDGDRDITDEPWAQGLVPGAVVLFLSDPQPVEPAITRMKWHRVPGDYMPDEPLLRLVPGLNTVELVA